MVQTKVIIRPQPGPQEMFLVSPADIVGYGGAAGGGKSFALLLEPLRHIQNSGFGGVIFRRTTEDIRKEGGLWDSSRDLYSQLGAKGREQYLDWTFPSGAAVTLCGLQHDSDVLNFQGSQICYLAFDEATHFSSRQFWYMLSRNRSICGVRPYVRLSFNPDPDSWVFELFGPWVDENHKNYGAQSGEIRYFLREDDEIRWVPKGTEDCKSITFIAANIYDNKILLKTDPGYLSNLKALDAQDRERLLMGRWSALQAKGALWRREWIDRDRIEKSELPEMERVVIGLDPSASAGPESDEAGIVAVGTANRHLYTLADESGIMTPEEWSKRTISLFDRLNASCIIAEKNMGGLMVQRCLWAERQGIPVKLVHAKQGKKVRAEPVAKMAQGGRDHHVGRFRALEGQLTRWVPDDTTESPDRLDAKVYACLELDPTLGTREHAGLL